MHKHSSLLVASALRSIRRGRWTKIPASSLQSSTSCVEMCCNRIARRTVSTDQESRVCTSKGRRRAKCGGTGTTGLMKIYSMMMKCIQETWMNHQPPSWPLIESLSILLTFRICTLHATGYKLQPKEFFWNLWVAADRVSTKH